MATFKVIERQPKGDVSQCLRCGFTWYPRKPGRPARCANPKCRSPYWNKERKK